ncbi:MAG: hypothetical protein QXQ31_06715 [Zestosphaera sp.]
MNNEFGVKSKVYDYDERFEQYKRIIARFEYNGEEALYTLNS